MRGDVGMEDRGEHTALGRSARIVARERDLDEVRLHFLQIGAHHPQAFDAILDLVAFRRIAFHLNEADAGMPADVVLELFAVGRQATKADVTHFFFLAGSGFLRGISSRSGIRSSNVGNEIEKLRPSAKRLSLVIVLMPMSWPSESYRPPPLLPGLMAAVVCRMRKLKSS